MKLINKNRYLLLLISILIFNSCKNQDKINANAIIKIDKKIFNFNQISINDSIKHTFTIKNISEIPLKITKVGTSCGCTTTNYPKGEILKGENADIDILFKPNSIGNIEKSIVVEANTDPTFSVFYIRGNVK